MATIAIVGAGLVGRRTAAMVADSGDHKVVLISRKRAAPAVAGVETGVGWPHALAADAAVVVLATDSAYQLPLAKQLVGSGTSVITTTADLSIVEQLYDLDGRARDREATIVVGAGYSPGVSTLLALHLAQSFDEITAIRTAHFGTGGPACARDHHRSMGASGSEVHQGRLRTARGGTGRELVWFPDPVGAVDCYRGRVSDPYLLRQAFPAVSRIESRHAATRRDRLTSRLPMLRPPHPEGLVGAVWAEVRGARAGRVEHRTMAATAPQATGAAAMAAAFCRYTLDLMAEARHGVVTAATVDRTSFFLGQIVPHVRLWTYDGSRIVTSETDGRPISAARKWRVPGEIAVIAANGPDR